MHTQPVDDSEGTFEEWQPVPERTCRKCRKKGSVSVRVWESNCGGYEDEQYRCSDCGHIWWIEGPDS